MSSSLSLSLTALLLVACTSSGGPARDADAALAPPDTTPPDAIAPDTVAPDTTAPDEVRHVVDYAHAAGSVVMDYRQPGQFLYGLPGAWLVRLVEHRRTSPWSSAYTIKIFVDDPGTHDHVAGDLLCTMTGSLSISAIAGFEPLDRVRAENRLEVDGCFGGEAMTEEEIWEVAARGDDGLPSLFAIWHPYGLKESDPAPEWVWNQGKANPWKLCVPEDYAAGRQYCRPACSWDYVNDPTGSCALD